MEDKSEDYPQTYENNSHTLSADNTQIIENKTKIQNSLWTNFIFD